jgi:transcriptional regulator
MYLPPHFEQKDKILAMQFVQQYPFGLLLTNGESIPSATHLPFLIEQEGEDYYLWSHLSKANPQAQALKDRTALVIFSEPHAYISPEYYTRESVPTWNYVAVHLSGQAELITEESAVLNLMEKSIQFFDEKYLEQWEQRTTSYIQKLLRGVIAFKIKITDWQAKEKLSQNRTPTEQQNIITGLSTSKDPLAQELGQIMKEKYKS